MDGVPEAAGGSLEIVMGNGCRLVVREGGYLPDFFCLETGDLVVFPWDYEPSAGAVAESGIDDDDDETAGAQEFFEPSEDDEDEDFERFGV